MNQRYSFLTLSVISSFSVIILFSNTEFAVTGLVLTPRGRSIHSVTSSNIINTILESYEKVSNAKFTISVQFMKHFTMFSQKTVKHNFIILQVNKQNERVDHLNTNDDLSISGISTTMMCQIRLSSSRTNQNNPTKYVAILRKR